MVLKARTRHWLAAASESALGALAGEVERIAHEMAESRATTDAQRQQQDASEVALRELACKVDCLSHDLAEVRAAVAEVDRQGQEIAALRADVTALRTEVEALRTSAQEHADRFANLGLRLDQNEAAIEQARTGLAGLIKQWGWDSDDLRKAIQALAERI